MFNTSMYVYIYIFIYLIYDVCRITPSFNKLTAGFGASMRTQAGRPRATQLTPCHAMPSWLVSVWVSLGFGLVGSVVGGKDDRLMG